MTLYRLYVVDEYGHVAAPPEIIDCQDDQEATQRAKQLLDGKPIEVWLEHRRVARLTRDE